MNRHFKIPVVLGLSAGILVGEMFGENKPHAEFVAVSPNPMVNIAVPNVTATTVSNVTRFESFTPVEWRMPHDHLVINVAGLVLPVGGKQ